MRLNERVAIITEKNMNRLEYLYGEIDIDDLSRIVNDHLKVAIDEIEEDLQRKVDCPILSLEDILDEYIFDEENE